MQEETPSRPNKSPHLKRVRLLPDLIADDRRKRPMSDTAWYNVGATEDREVAFAGTWGNEGNPFAPASWYLSNSGEVRFRGVVSGGVEGQTIMILPEEIRPQYTQVFACSVITGGTANISIDVGGNMILESISP